MDCFASAPATPHVHERNWGIAGRNCEKEVRRTKRATSSASSGREATSKQTHYKTRNNQQCLKHQWPLFLGQHTCMPHYAFALEMSQVEGTSCRESSSHGSQRQNASRPLTAHETPAQRSRSTNAKPTDKEYQSAFLGRESKRTLQI